MADGELNPPGGRAAVDPAHGDRIGHRRGGGSVAIVAGYRAYTDRYTVETKGPDDRAVSMVVESTLAGASDLKVSTLKGTVQGTASDTRGFGWINSTRVMKAPFEVEYFVDVSRARRERFHLGSGEPQADRAPAAGSGRAASTSIESRTYLDQTKGVFVTRAAMAAMQKQASGRAQRVARDEALKPDKLAAARRNAETALATLFTGPLKAAGIDATVEVRVGGGIGSRRPALGMYRGRFRRCWATVPEHFAWWCVSLRSWQRTHAAPAEAGGQLRTLTILGPGLRRGSE